MRIPSVLFLSLFLFTASFAAEEPTKQFKPEANEVCTQLFDSGATSEQLAQRGCCSWHSGVCGCGSDGRVKCCDGTTSPSCTCHKADEGKGVIN